MRGTESALSALSRAMIFAKKKGKTLFLSDLLALEADISSLSAEQLDKSMLDLLNKHQFGAEAVAFIFGNCVRRQDGLYEKMR